MTLALQALLADLIDYAGLFPPAALDMTAAVRNYAAYRKGDYAQYSWMLGRFILPVARLAEFERAAEERLQNDDPWQLSALAGDDLQADISRIADFNRRNHGRALVDAIELKAYSDQEISAAMKILPESLAAYFEIPIASDPRKLIGAIGEAGGRAKVRTGAVTADGFPSSPNLARFIEACAAEDVPFKATAGLHHPIRSVNNLTYEPNSRKAMMHGFLNVFLAAAFAQNGVNAEDLVGLLNEGSPEAFQFDQGSVTWRSRMLVRGQLRVARSLLAIAFGSCSFVEPIEDLKKINLL